MGYSYAQNLPARLSRERVFYYPESGETMWPQIGEYTENGKTVRVFKASLAAYDCWLATGLFPKGSQSIPRNKNGKQIIGSGIKELPTNELRF